MKYSIKLPESLQNSPRFDVDLSRILEGQLIRSTFSLHCTLASLITVGITLLNLDNWSPFLESPDN